MMDVSARQHIKGYDLRERIGAGGFGAVYKAYQSTVGREVAIKIILPGLASQPDFIRRFEGEAQLVARLEHPHITPLYDYWRDPDGAYLVMRWLRGGSLRDSLEHGAFELPAAALLLDQIAGALSLAHRSGVIHRDIKPANILLDEDSNAYLTDFGIAKDLNMVNSNTQQDAIVGSLDYISPEQARSEPVTPRTDIYSLGVTMYEVITGHHPFENISSIERLYKHINDPLPEITGLTSSVESDVNRVIQKATAKNPELRYPDALAFAADFREAIGMNRSSTTVVELLTQREHEILQMIMEGLANKEIAQRSTIAIGTVKWHVNQIYSKLGVRNRVQAIVRARELDLIVKPGQAATAVPIPTEDFHPQNPYKGLLAFQSADNQDFFGREKVTAKLIRRMGETVDYHRFLAVVGPSGSGKSSLVRAGLIPALWRGELPGSEKWFIVDMLPGAHPLEELEVALTRIAANQTAHLNEHLTRDERGLVRAAALILPNDGSELVLIIDQFEEVFTLLSDEATRQHFLNLIYAAVTEPRSRIRVIITLRADFYDRPLYYPRFGELTRSRLETLMPLSADELERAISAPAGRVGVTFEPGLVASIIGDVNYQSGALPLLQYALTELFEQRQGRILTRSAYQEMGGTVGALAKRADELYTMLDAAGQEAAYQIFMRLVTPGEGTQDTRHRATRSELLALTDNPELAEEILDMYTGYRLLSVDHEPVTHAPTVEVAHESLLNQWERLRFWLNDVRNEIMLRQQFTQASTEWHNASRDASFLLRGARLERSETWASETRLALTGKERDFLDASLQARAHEREVQQAQQIRETALEQRSRRFLRGLVGVFAAAAVLSILLAGFAFNQRQVADEARTISDQNAEIASENADYASSIALAAAANSAQLLDNPDQAIALAVAANSVTDQPPAFAQSILYDVAFATATSHVYEGLPTIEGRLVISPDGKHVLSWDVDNRIAYWELADGKILYDGKPDFVHDAIISIVVFALDGKSAFAQIVNKDELSGSVIEFDVQTGELIREFELPAGTTGLSSNWWQVALSPDGQLLVAELYETTPGAGISDSGHLYGWDTTSGKLIFKSGELPSKQPYVPHWFDFSDDGQQLLMTVESGFAYVWDARTGDYIRTYGEAVELDGPNVWGFFTPAGIVIATQDSGTYTTTVSLWDAATGEKLRETSWASSSNWATMSSDGRTLALSLVASQIALLDINTWEKTDLFGHTFSVRGTAFTPGNHHLLSASDDTTVRLWNLDNSSVIQRLTGSASFFSSLVISPDGKMAASQEYFEYEDGRLLLWDLQTGKLIRTLAMNKGTLGSVAFSPDGKSIFSGSTTNAYVCGDVGSVLHLSDVATGKMLWEVKKENGSTFGAATFTRDGSRILTVDWSCENFVTVWDAVTGKKLDTWDGHSAGIWAIDASYDGKYVATGSMDGTALIRNASDGSIVHTLNHTSNVASVRFSPDSQVLLTAEQSGVIHLWDVATGQEIRQFTRHSSYVVFQSFSPDGRYVVSSSGADGNIFVWDTQTGDAIRQFHQPVISPIGSVVAFSADGQSIYFSDDQNNIRQVNLMLQPGELMDWIHQNRYIRDLTCGERELYRIEPVCQAS